ncbi:MAG: hypothetical protein DRN20_05600 [Thermoplasmata archaeon]|nr:MAG: hypothetical protein DRN20_05600 [Thermoplasmata archaeon]
MEKMERVPTGIKGLDELMDGGFPAGTVNLVSGPAGSAKSLLGMHYIYNGALMHGDNGIYITLEEPRKNILRAMLAYNMEIERLEKEGKLYLIDLSEMRRLSKNVTVEEAIVGFKPLQDMLEHLLEFSKAKRLCIDSLTAIGLHYGDDVSAFRRDLFRFVAFLRSTGITSLLITEAAEGEGLTRFGVEQFVADSFIYLGLEESMGELRRTITIRKMRFTRHDTAKHPIIIDSSGLNVSAETKVF